MATSILRWSWWNRYHFNESLIETDSSDEQSDDNKYKNLKDLKALLDAGILTQEEFDAQKKEILNS